MKIKDTEAFRAKQSNQYSRPTCKNCSYLGAVCTVIIVHNTVAQRHEVMHCNAVNKDDVFNILQLHI